VDIIEQLTRYLFYSKSNTLDTDLQWIHAPCYSLVCHYYYYHSLVSVNISKQYLKKEKKGTEKGEPEEGILLPLWNPYIALLRVETLQFHFRSCYCLIN